MLAGEGGNSQVPGNKRRRPSWRKRLQRKIETVEQMKATLAELRAETKRMKKAEKKVKAKLKEMEVENTQMREQNRMMAEDSAWATVCVDLILAVVGAEDEGDLLVVRSLSQAFSELMAPPS